MKRQIISIITLVISGSLISVGANSAGAQTSRNEAPTTGTVSAKDRQFVVEATGAGASEVELGKLAVKKGTSEQVRAFAEKMVEDHSKAGAELKKIADSKNIRPEGKPDPAHLEAKAKLDKLSGAEFDREYMKIQREDHRKAVDLFKKQAGSGNDSELKRFASSTLPTLEMHKHMADQMPADSARK